MLDYVKMDSNTDPQVVIDAMHRAKVVQLDALVEYIKRLEQDKAELVEALVAQEKELLAQERLVAKLQEKLEQR